MLNNTTSKLIYVNDKLIFCHNVLQNDNIIQSGLKITEQHNMIKTL